MNIANVISVNPGVKTLGELRINDRALGTIGRKLSLKRKKAVSPLKTAVNLALGLNSRVTSFFSGKMMLLRLIFGALFISMALVPMTPEAILSGSFDTVSAVECAVGVSVAFGLFARLASLFATGFFGWIFYLSCEGGNIEWMYAVITAVTLTVCVLGPGMYCIDQFIRRCIYHMSSRRKEQKNDCMSYNAYLKVDRSF